MPVGNVWPQNPPHLEPGCGWAEIFRGSATYSSKVPFNRTAPRVLRIISVEKNFNWTPIWSLSSGLCYSRSFSWPFVWETAELLWPLRGLSPAPGSTWGLLSSARAPVRLTGAAPLNQSAEYLHLTNFKFPGEKNAWGTFFLFNFISFFLMRLLFSLVFLMPCSTSLNIRTKLSVITPGLDTSMLH